MSKVKVIIKAKTVIEFDQEVEMDEADFLILKDLDDDCVSERDKNKEYALLEKYIDYNNVLDSGHEFTDVDVRITKKGKP